MRGAGRWGWGLALLSLGCVRSPEEVSGSTSTQGSTSTGATDTSSTVGSTSSAPVPDGTGGSSGSGGTTQGTGPESTSTGSTSTGSGSESGSTGSGSGSGSTDGSSTGSSGSVSTSTGGSGSGSTSTGGSSSSGGPTCDDLYDMAPGYSLCMETDTECQFNVELMGGNCDQVCSTFGGVCLGAFDNGNPCEYLPDNTDTCFTTHFNEICVCSK